MLKQLISSFFARSTVALCALAVLLVQSRQLGSEELGYVSLVVLNLAVIQSISDIYTGPALVYFIPRHSLKKLYVLGILWTFGATVLLNLIFYLFHIGVPALWSHVLTLSVILVLHSFHTVILLAKQRIRIYNFLIFFQPLLLFAGLCTNIYILNIGDVYAYVFAAYVSWGLSLLISAIAVAQVLKTDTLKEEVDLKKVLRNGLVNQLGNLAHTLSNRYNYYMITTAALLGVYASATSLIESVWILSGSISPIVLTHIANRNDEPNNGRVTFVLSKICFLLSLLCVLIVLILPENFFTFLLGKDFSGTKALMLNLSPGVLLLSFSSIISHYFSGLGKQRILLLANGCGLLVTLCCSYYFIKQFGILGACYTASLSYATQAVVLIWAFMRQNQFKLVTLFQIRKDIALLQPENNN